MRKTPLAFGWLKKFKLFCFVTPSKSQLYEEFFKFRVTTSSIFMHLVLTFYGLSIVIESILSFSWSFLLLGFFYTGFINVLFFFLRKRPSFIQIGVSFLLIVRAVVRTVVLQVLGYTASEFYPSVFMASTMVTLLLGQVVPSVFIHFTVFLTELWVIIFFSVFFSSLWPHETHMYLYLIMVALFSIHSIVVDRKLWEFFLKNREANNQIESLKSFLDKNLLSSIMIFSIQDQLGKNNFTFHSDESGELARSFMENDNIKMEFFNFQARKLARFMRNSSAGDDGGTSSMRDSLSETEPPLSLEELARFSRKGSGASLVKEMNEYVENVRKISEKKDKNLNEIRERMAQPKSFFCSLEREKEKERSFEGANRIEGEREQKGEKLIYKTVMSPIVFNNKESVVLQLEDVTYIKNLEKERKVSQIRQKTIQYIFFFFFFLGLKRPHSQSQIGK